MVRVLAGIGVVVAGLGAVLFWVQNSGRATQLSFDAGFAAWELHEPVSIPVLVTGCFALGCVVGALGGWWLARRGSAPPSNADTTGTW